MLKRMLLLFTILLASVSTANADYVIIRININQLNFIPNAIPGIPGGNVGGVPGGNVGGVPGGNVGGVPGTAIGGLPGNIAGGQQLGMPGAAFIGFFPGGMGAGGGFPPPPPPPGGDPSAQPGGPPGGLPPFMAEDPNARYLSGVVEMRNFSKPAPTPFGLVFKYDHDWGTNNWLILSPLAPYFMGQFDSKGFWAEFNPEFNKAKSSKNVEDLLHLARRCLSLGKLSAFHRVMDEVVKLNPKHLNVKNYQKIQRDLAKPFTTEDPAQRELIEKWREEKYRAHTSKKGHYRIYAQIISSDRNTEKVIERRLAMFEDVMETFYYWFAVQRDNTTLPAMPKYILPVLLTGSKTDLNDRRLQWGNEPMTTEGFTPRRDNVIIMPARIRENDATFMDYERILDEKIREANSKFAEMGIRVTMTKENLLSGKITEATKEAGKGAAFIAIAQTAVALWHSLQLESERHAVTHEGVRQLLTASNMFPRNVQTPEWLVVGMASLLETPAGAVHPTIGSPSWTHLVNFKHYRNAKMLENPAQVMQQVVSDTFFHEARRLAKQANESPNEKSIAAAKESWELASSTAWALVYYLSQSNRLDHFFKYGKELDKLPRDLDLSSAIMESCLAKAFDIPDTRDPRRINRSRFDALAANWFEVMQGANLDHPKLQGHFEKMRAMRSNTAMPGGAAPMPNPGGMPPVPGVVPPMPGQGGNPGGANPGNPGFVAPNPGGAQPPPRLPPGKGAGAG